MTVHISVKSLVRTPSLLLTISPCCPRWRICRSYTRAPRMAQGPSIAFRRSHNLEGMLLLARLRRERTQQCNPHPKYPQMRRGTKANREVKGDWLVWLPPQDPLSFPPRIGCPVMARRLAARDAFFPCLRQRGCPPYFWTTWTMSCIMHNGNLMLTLSFECMLV